jgi:hypothetical protein
VDRCGREVRYVIDFYFNDDKAGTDEASPCMALGVASCLRHRCARARFGSPGFTCLGRLMYSQSLFVGVLS